jgi:hypothetical protein
VEDHIAWARGSAWFSGLDTGLHLLCYGCGNASPKLLSRIVRLKNASDTKERNSTKSWTDVAHEIGYYDHCASWGISFGHRLFRGPDVSTPLIAFSKGRIRRQTAQRMEWHRLDQLNLTHAQPLRRKITPRMLKSRSPRVMPGDRPRSILVDGGKLLGSFSLRTLSSVASRYR